jgi:hypothetical protein
MKGDTGAITETVSNIQRSHGVSVVTMMTVSSNEK